MKFFQKEMTWTRAIIFALAITVGFVITQGIIPSRFIYWWGGQSQRVIEIVADLTGWQMQQYTTVRIRDAIIMGYETTAFAIPVAITYFVMEKRRRRLGLQGADAPKEYLSGK